MTDLGTSGGVAITDELVEQLADEAEAGYELDRLAGYQPEPAPEPVLRDGVTACIVTHPARARNGKLLRALTSVVAQTLQPEAILVCNDTGRLGPAANRQHILDQVQTRWMAWLDSDDEWYPNHLQDCMETAEALQAWFVFPWFDPADSDPLGHFGLPFNPATPHHTTITFLVRTELARRIGFSPEAAVPGFANEDWHHITGICQIMAAEDLPAVHLAKRTWFWHMDGGNTSGIPDQGDARRDGRDG